MIEIKSQTHQDRSISFYTQDPDTPIMEIRPDGFYVRGVKLEQDDKEAQAVYKAFHQWLTLAWLQHDDNR